MKSSTENRAALLKSLREQHQTSVNATQALLKELQAVRKVIRQVMQAGSKTIPEIAATTNLPTDQVLWHVIAMKKYNLVTETGLDDGYYRYSLVEDAKR